MIKVAKFITICSRTNLVQDSTFGYEKKTFFYLIWIIALEVAFLVCFLAKTPPIF